MAKHLLVVLSNTTEGAGDDATFNEWYTNQHLGDILKLSGYVRAERYAASSAQLGDGALPYKYLAIYEVESEDAADAAAALGSGTGGMYISPTLDRDRTVAWFFTPIAGAVRDATAKGAMA